MAPAEAISALQETQPSDPPLRPVLRRRSSRVSRTRSPLVTRLRTAWARVLPRADRETLSVSIGLIGSLVRRNTAFLPEPASAPAPERPHNDPADPLSVPWPASPALHRPSATALHVRRDAVQSGQPVRSRPRRRPVGSAQYHALGQRRGRASTAARRAQAASSNRAERGPFAGSFSTSLVREWTTRNGKALL